MSQPPIAPTYILEVSDAVPRQYRISVLRTVAEHITWRMNYDENNGFKVAANTEDAQQLFRLIEVYVQLEISS